MYNLHYSMKYNRLPTATIFHAIEMAILTFDLLDPWEIVPNYPNPLPLSTLCKLAKEAI